MILMHAAIAIAVVGFFIALIALPKEEEVTQEVAQSNRSVKDQVVENWYQKAIPTPFIHTVDTPVQFLVYFKTASQISSSPYSSDLFNIGEQIGEEL